MPAGEKCLPGGALHTKRSLDRHGSHSQTSYSLNKPCSPQLEGQHGMAVATYHSELL